MRLRRGSGGIDGGMWVYSEMEKRSSAEPGGTEEMALSLCLLYKYYEICLRQSLVPVRTASAVPQFVAVHEVYLNPLSVSSLPFK